MYSTGILSDVIVNFIVSLRVGLSELKEMAQMHNAIIIAHVAFYTDESIRQITEKTLSNFEGFNGFAQLDEAAFVA